MKNEQNTELLPPPLTHGRDLTNIDANKLFQTTTDWGIAFSINESYKPTMYFSSIKRKLSQEDT